VLVVAAVALGAYSSGAPSRLALGGWLTEGSESERGTAILSAQAGFDAEPAYLVALIGTEPITSPSSEVAVAAVSAQIEAIDGVAAVLDRGPSADGLARALAVHTEPGLDSGRTVRIEDQLRGELDPGALGFVVGGSLATQDGARSAALGEVLGLLLLALPLLLLVLVGSLGIKPALAALLGALLAASAAVSAIGLLGELTTIGAIGVVGAVPLGAVLAIEAGAGLLFRYREEAATLGAGPEALEYTLHSLLRAAGIGMFSAALVGVSLLVIPVESVRSIGVGVIAAALLAPLLGTLPMAALLSATGGAQIGETLPLISEDARSGSGPPVFRAFLTLGRGRRRGMVAILPVMIAAALALPVLDSEAIGLDAAELPDTQPAASAGAEITAVFGAGANGPLTILGEGPAETAAVAIYRDAIARLEEIESVSRPRPFGELSAFDAAPAARPQSLAAQRAVDDTRAVPAPSRSLVSGPAAGLSDSARRLADDLPLVALVALLGTAALWSLLFRSVFGPLLALSAVIAPLAGVAAMLGVFSGGHLTGLLDYTDSGAPHLPAFVIVGSVLLALGLARGASFAAALREERLLGGGAAGSLARSGLLTLMPFSVATLAGVVIAGVWLGSDLLPAKELALGLTAGLAADLLVSRILLAPALARLSLQSNSVAA
jgi:RND superfamily putative drug exporter